MTSLTIGKKAPAFKAEDQDGNLIALSDFKGKHVLLYFYPQDDTPTCTVQACNLRDHFSLLAKKGIVVIGVSPDGVSKHKKFETKHGLPFTLIADSDHQLIKKYGVWGEKKLYGRAYMGLHRTSFLIDGKGMIRHIWLKPKSAIHASEVLAIFDEIFKEKK